MSPDAYMPSARYCGFYITRAIGNNRFSFDERRCKKIYVPPLKEGDVSDLSCGTEIVFAEIEDGTEYCKSGLDSFIHTTFGKAPVFIFDNHNHAFFFWALALKKGWIDKGDLLVHVDQHTDMRKPEKWLACSALSDLDAVFDYTNFELNVGNFIQPALNCGIFSAVDIIDHREAFEKDYDAPFVLDIDMDIFSPDMAYIRDSKKMCTIRHFMRKAKFITFATSPYFMDQARAVSLVHALFA